MTGGATFDKGESSLRKVKCEKTADGDLLVTRSELFGRDLYETSVGRDSPFGMAEHDAGGDHAWPDDSGKYLWVSTFRYDDPNQFDIFLVMTGGATFDAGESSLRKVKCEKTPDGDLLVTRSELFGRDLYEASVGRDSPFGMAEYDAGGDHAWPDESGKYLWVSTFRTGNAGVHMLDYETGELIYSVHGMDRWYEHKTGKQNYAYSAGIHGIGQLGTPSSTLVVGTSACTNTNVCMPIPYLPITPESLEAVGVMFAIDL